jgi:hypothetical protein
MNHPEYRKRGWPIGSGKTEAAVKQFNKRIKGTEQFWSTDGVETILALRGLWGSARTTAGNATGKTAARMSTEGARPVWRTRQTWADIASCLWALGGADIPVCQSCRRNIPVPSFLSPRFSENK